jgi:hypothetical protein
MARFRALMAPSRLKGLETESIPRIRGRQKTVRIAAVNISRQTRRTMLVSRLCAVPE